MREGVIQFAVDHVERPLSPAESDRATSLMGWRSVMVDTGLLGVDPARYDGIGFGNVSARVGARSAARGARPFVVSGSQTSLVGDVGAQHFCVVNGWRLRDNHLTSEGPVLPSSESLTHGTIYDEGPHITAVLHAHSPDIWRNYEALLLPSTPPGVDYGTVAMGDATRKLFQAGRVLECQAYVMRGHEDGVVVFGKTIDDAGAVLMRLLAAARILS